MVTLHLLRVEIPSGLEKGQLRKFSALPQEIQEISGMGAGRNPLEPLSPYHLVFSLFL
jgi:hypothetical protein